MKKIINKREFNTLKLKKEMLEKNIIDLQERHIQDLRKLNRILEENDVLKSELIEKYKEDINKLKLKMKGNKESENK